MDAARKNHIQRLRKKIWNLFEISALKVNACLPANDFAIAPIPAYHAKGLHHGDWKKS